MRRRDPAQCRVPAVSLSPGEGGPGGKKSMIVIIDREKCVSCGTCWESCPDVFEENPDDSYSQITEEFRIGGNIGEGRPSADFEDCAAHAASECCAEVISVEED